MEGGETTGRPTAQELLENYQHLVTPNKWLEQAGTWPRNLEITKLSLDPDRSFRRIGQGFGISGSRVERIAKETLTKIYLACPAEIRSSVSLGEILQTNLTREEVFTKYSKGSGSLSLRVADLICQGADYEDIVRAGITPLQLGYARKTLKQYGLTVPQKQSRSVHLFAELDTHPSDEKIKVILSQIDQAAEAYHRYHRLTLLTSLTSIISTLGSSFNRRQIPQLVSRIKEAGIPIATVTHYNPRKRQLDRTRLLSCWHTDQVTSFILSDEEFKVSEKPRSIEQIGGEKTPLPSSYDLLFGGQFQSLGSAFAELGMPSSNWRFFFDPSLLEKSPVPTYRLSRQRLGRPGYLWYVDSEQKESLKRFVHSIQALNR